MSPCVRPHCHGPVYRNRHCHLHYLKRHRAGQTRRVPTADGSALIERLYTHHWTTLDVARRAGLAASTVHAIHQRHYPTMLRATYRKLAAIAEHPQRRSGTYQRVPITGFRRRAHALAYMGWGMKDQARMMGYGPGTVETVTRRHSQTVSVRLDDAMRALFDRLALQPGPNPVAAGVARKRGWAPPLAWDDDTIDDPAARPNYGYRPSGLPRRGAA
ncbi:hypothetical protein [Actinopolyspora halophila]|uniref:hypothetical protein n=1 Tax=Actinopolyspora halophila TaxID=1850 RepID=UPI0003751F7F|nr:hypothetical protein [Actinopolyspora halophila]